MAFLFGKKKGPEQPAMPMELPPDIPIDLVIQLRQQGLTNNQIIQTLQRQGSNSDQIFEALSQADVKGGVDSVPPEQMVPMGPMDNPMQTPQPDYPNYQQDYQQDYGYSQREDRMEQIAEQIINEKWAEVTKDLTRLSEWKDQTDIHLSKLQQSVDELRNSFDKLHQALVGKIADYDKNILEVGTEIKAMERVFQKILPTFTENVNELSRITKDAKKKKQP